MLGLVCRSTRCSMIAFFVVLAFLSTSFTQPTTFAQALSADTIVVQAEVMNHSIPNINSTSLHRLKIFHVHTTTCSEEGSDTQDSSPGPNHAVVVHSMSDTTSLRDLQRDERPLAACKVSSGSAAVRGSPAKHARLQAVLEESFRIACISFNENDTNIEGCSASLQHRKRTTLAVIDLGSANNKVLLHKSISSERPTASVRPIQGHSRERTNNICAVTVVTNAQGVSMDHIHDESSEISNSTELTATNAVRRLIFTIRVNDTHNRISGAASDSRVLHRWDARDAAPTVRSFSALCGGGGSGPVATPPPRAPPPPTDPPPPPPPPPTPPPPTPSPPVPCTNDDCNNRADSVSGDQPSCSCSCLAEWTGSTCASSNVCTNSADCSGRATSFSGNRPSCSCNCPPEWIGSSCEISNLCTNDDCSGHAIAVSGIRPSCTCTCPGEWIGAKCEIFNVCTSAVDCSNHAGRVVGNRPACTCYCLAAYHGKTCDVTYTLTPTATYSLELTSENSVIHTLTSSESTSGWNTKSVSGSASSSLSGSQSMSQQRRTTSFSFSLTMSTSLRTESQHVARSVSSTPSFSVSPKTDSGMPTSSPSHSPSRFVSNTSSFLVTSSVFASGNVTATPPSLSSSNSSSPTTTIPLSRPTCVAPSLTLSVPYVSSTATLSTSTTPLPCRALLEQTHARLYISLSLLTSPLIVLSNTSATSSYTMLVFQNQSLLNPQVNNVDAKGVVAVPVASIGIDRRTLINAGGTSGSPTIVANLTIHAAGQHATGLRIKNVRLNGNISLQHTYPYYGDSWHVVTLAPSPEYGWVSVSIWKTAAIILDVHMTCGADDAVRVHIVVPAPGIQQQLAAEVKAAALSSQLIALVAGGASSGAALGRLMATRSMVMCDADGAVGGGVLDLGIVPCSVEDNSNNFARSAVISDAVLVGIVGLVILLCGILLASVDPNDHNVFCTSTTIMLLPSSLLTVFVSVLPSIAASATLLAARLDASSCRAVDVVLVILAIVLTLTPIASLVLLYRHASINRWKCVVKQRSHDEISAAPNTKSHDSSWGLINTQFRSVLRQATRRRYAWQHDGSDKQTTIFQHSMVVLLEYRVLWYAVLDSSVLVAVGVLAVVGGLSHCTPIIALVMALLGAQLLLLIAARPYTTMFENIYSGTTLSLTLLSVAGQLVFASADSDGGVQDREWALTMSAVCDFVIVGVSLVKSMMDGYGVAMGARRRVLQAASVRRKASLLVVGQGKEVSIVVAQSGDDGNALNLEDVVMDEKHSVHNNEGGDQSMFAEIERQFWHSNGTARLDDNEFGMDDSDDTVL